MSTPNPQGDRAPTPRKTANPLIWILVLIALLAFGWYFYNQRGAVPPPPEAQAPVTIGSAQDAAAERERAGAERRAREADPADAAARP